MQILNQPTEPTTVSIANGDYLDERRVEDYKQPYMVFGDHGFTHTYHTSEELSYWLYNKNVPIPKLPKCVSSRIHAPSRGWRNGGKGKTAPVIDGGWLKEKV